MPSRMRSRPNRKSSAAVSSPVSSNVDEANSAATSGKRSGSTRARHRAAVVPLYLVLVQAGAASAGLESTTSWEALRTYPPTSITAPTFAPQSSPVSRRIPRPASSQAIEFGPLGGPGIGRRASQGCRAKIGLLTGAQVRSPARHLRGSLETRVRDR